MKINICSILLLGLSLCFLSAKAQVAMPFQETFNNTTSTTMSQWDYSNPAVIVNHHPEQGGYGLDSGCLFYNFFNSSGLSEYNVKSPVINNVDGFGLKVQFDFAGCVRYTMPASIPQDFALDYIYVEYSKDGGTTWTLHDTFRIGTNGPLNTYGGSGISPASHFNPSSSQWTTISDIKLPRGTNRVAFKGVRFNNISSNMAYLDNVKIDTCYTPIPSADTLQYDSTFATVADLVANGSNLKWYSDINGNTSIGDTTSLADSVYYYVSQTINGCESALVGILFADTTTAQPPVDTSTNVKNIDIFKDVKIYPNPTSDIVEIQSNLNFDAMRLTDVLGKTVLRLKSEGKMIDLKALSSGIYFLNVSYKNATHTFKIIKQ